MTAKNIGLMALGRRATDFYLEELARDEIHPHLLETDFDNDINPYLPGNVFILDGRLKTELDRFKNVDAILMPNITLHETLDRIDADGSRYPVIHAVRETIKLLKARGVKTITLFGSLHSMNSPYPKEVFEEQGIEVKIPTAKDQAFIDEFRQKLYGAQENDDDLAHYQKLVKKYQKSGEVVVACTELSLVSERGNGLWDMVRVQIEQAAK